MRLLGRADYPGNLTSREICFPRRLAQWKSLPHGKIYIPEIWLPGKFDFTGKSPTQKSWLSGKVDFPGKYISWGNWCPRKVGFSWKLASLESLLLLKVGFSWKLPSLECWLDRIFILPGSCFHRVFEKSVLAIDTAGSWRTFPSCFYEECNLSLSMRGKFLRPLFLLCCSDGVTADTLDAANGNKVSGYASKLHILAP